MCAVGPEGSVLLPPKLLVKLLSLSLTCQVGEEHFTNKDRYDGVMLLCQEPWCHENLVKGLLNALASRCGEEMLNLLMQLLYQSVSLLS